MVPATIKRCRICSENAMSYLGHLVLGVTSKVKRTLRFDGRRADVPAGGSKAART